MARKTKAQLSLPKQELIINTDRPPMAERRIANMTFGAKMRRRKFVFAYLKTFSVVSAYRATGYKGKDKYAQIKGYQMLREPYVQMLLYKTLGRMDANEIVTTNEVLAGLKREANFMEEGTTHSARVAAWAHLGRLLGLGGPEGPGATVINNTGNVMVVPIADDDESWESQAVQSQKLLRNSIKTVNE